MQHVTLRKLASDYAEHILGKEEYRKSRAALLQGIVSGEIELRANDYLPPVIPKQDFPNAEIDEQSTKADGDITEFHAETQAAPSSVKKTPEGRQKFIIIGSGLLIGIVLLIALSPDNKETGTTTGKTASVEQNRPVTHAAPGEAQKLIQDFLEKKDWSDTGLSNFKTRWQSLTTAQQAAATGSIQLSRLTNSIYKKLLEERALSGLSNDEEALNKQRKLLEFANNIGINDPRIRLPEGTRP